MIKLIITVIIVFKVNIHLIKIMIVNFANKQQDWTSNIVQVEI